VPVRDDTVYRRVDGTAEEWTARYVNGPAAAGVFNLPLVAGSLDDLTGADAVAVPAGEKKGVGSAFDLWLDDGTPVRLRVVAVFADQLDLVGTVLLPWEMRPVPLATAVYLGGGSDAMAAAEEVAAAGGATIAATGDLLSASDVEQDRINRLALIAVLGLALAYTGISIANTLVMATNDRARDLATLRLAGATPAQVLRMIAVEAVLVTGIGVILAAVVATATVIGVRRSIGDLAASTPVIVPWESVGGIALACLVTAVLASVIPAAVLLRRRPVELAGVPE
jgi:putative ABC transport system permease protein